jgi:hypothetical protein
MEKFAAESFFNIASNLAGKSAQYFGDGKTVQLLPLTLRRQLGDSLQDTGHSCRTIGLRVAARQFEMAATMLFEHTSGISNAQVSQMLLDLGSAITSEMSENLFLRVFSERTPYYRQAEGFGSAVAKSFPSAARDIQEAGSCYATDRNTACVMHLMRVLEVGLSVLAAQFRISSDRRNWENIINDIEAGIKKVSGPHAGSDWKQRQQFWSEAAKDFRYFKDAWRNHAMHFREHYEAPEARTVFDHVQTFMQQLASGGLSEKQP